MPRNQKNHARMRALTTIAELPDDLSGSALLEGGTSGAYRA